MARTLELLAPARDLATGIRAIDVGADAVYIGGPSHGARATASNTVDDIRRLCEYAHKFRARVYVTLNTLIYDNELTEVEREVAALYRAGVDALIVQDMGLLRMSLPPIALHASTQCDTRTVDKAVFLAECGFTQIVLPREFTLDEIRQVAARVDVSLEAFVHGALCVCYSGDCRASLVSGGRSANRGECAQICRLPYDLTDKNVAVIMSHRHLLSLRDLNRVSQLEAMADAGISSFKIEGRLKNISYVTNVVAAYSAALDALCHSRPNDYCRRSKGISAPTFVPDLNRTFNRQYTSYFLTQRQPGKGMLSSSLTPKFMGMPVGKVINTRHKTITIKTGEALHNGDGITWFDSKGDFCGVRINRADGTTLFVAREVNVAPGTTLYRNFDKQYEDMLASLSMRRILPVDITLRPIAGGITVDIRDKARNLYTSASIDCDTSQQAKTSQYEARHGVFSKLGDTFYTLDTFEDRLGDIFIPKSILTDLKRKALESLEQAALATYPYECRRPENHSATLWSENLTFHDNVANRLASEFYRSHGAQTIEPAMETAIPDNGSDVHVMTTRYCLRRELGACLKTPTARRLPSPLYLRPCGADTVRTMRIDFDCVNCQMLIYAVGDKHRR